MLTKRLLLKVLDNNWSISNSLMRNFYLTHRQIAGYSRQRCSLCKTALSASLSSRCQYQECRKTSEYLCSHSFHTCVNRYKNADSKRLQDEMVCAPISHKADEVDNTDKQHQHEQHTECDLEQANPQEKFPQVKELWSNSNAEEMQTSVISKLSAFESEENGKEIAVVDFESNIAKIRKGPPGEPVSIIDQLVCTSVEGSISDSHSTDISTRVSNTSVSTQTTVSKVRIPPLYSVSPIVNESEVLKSLVELGVDVSVYVEKGVAEKVILMDFERDIKPYIMLLYNAGVSEDRLGAVLTKNPYIFEHDVEHLQVRINYLLSKRFTKEQIGLMLYREAIFICMETKRIDAKLGFYQKEFRLKGAELRNTVGRFAKLITHSVRQFKENKVYMKEFLGFTDSELKEIFLISPNIFFSDMQAVSRKFDHLHNVMEIPHQQIALEGWVLRKNFVVLHTRHRFLLKLGRAQYNPLQENYVSIGALMNKDKEYFCVEVAKASVMEFDEFQRLI